MAVKKLKDLSTRYPRFRRIISMLLDHYLMCILIIPFAILLSITVRALKFQFYDEMGFFVLILFVFVYFNKDFLNGKSPAKRLLGYQVVDLRTNLPASEFKCFVRNLTICVAWPIEVVVGFINPSRRIGDYISGTKVVNAEKEKLQTLINEFKKQHLKRDYFWILLLAVLYSFSLILILLFLGIVVI